ncbi:MAG: hypothetical protein N2561_08040 [Bacteroidetes bacterium]|nr:hypothetical protein [Rhodothermia bacterium]MCS7155443.1 hypothetical protein [Bacteroidota bacterium]MCX7907464.1 hypothetical protein [Bacteroidota bacterium]MDW8138458.1 hypothetical protein [Bacteroidota bacterium]MDW8284605.1 hypothetical protein [Bacteroidota bacterium]
MRRWVALVASLMPSIAGWGQVWRGRTADWASPPMSVLWINGHQASFQHQTGSSTLDWSGWAPGLMFSQPNLDLFLSWQPRAGGKRLEYWEAGGHLWGGLPVAPLWALEVPFGLFAGYRSVSPQGAMREGISVSVLTFGGGLGWRPSIGRGLWGLLRAAPFGGLAFESFGLRNGRSLGFVAEVRLYTDRIGASRWGLAFGAGYRHWRWVFEDSQLNYLWSDVRVSLGLSF